MNYKEVVEYANLLNLPSDKRTVAIKEKYGKLGGDMFKHVADLKKDLKGYIRLMKALGL